MAEGLAGRTAVVTGGASGIGYALAERFAAEGMRLVLADVEEAALERAAKELGDRAEVLAVPTDVTDPVSVDALRDRALDRFGSVHVVCNNAGVAGLSDLSWEGPLEGWEWVLGVNVWGVIHGVRAFVPHLLEQDAGHVVNTASLAGLSSLPAFGPYCASKHAVVAMSEVLFHELAMRGSGVRVHVLCPGFLRTQIAHAERNWPDRLGPRPPDRTDAEAGMMRELAQGLVDAGLPPERLADALLEAMATGRFLVTTHPDEAAAATAARARVVGGADPRLADL
jgi:NAD(P)-dependent dehydrogenase (short-subunit alcohol dehydrogenase family)